MQVLVIIYKKDIII